MRAQIRLLDERQIFALLDRTVDLASDDLLAKLVVDYISLIRLLQKQTPTRAWRRRSESSKRPA